MNGIVAPGVNGGPSFRSSASMPVSFPPAPGGPIHTARAYGRSKRVLVRGPLGTRADWAGYQAAMATAIHLPVAVDGPGPLAGVGKRVLNHLVPVDELAHAEAARQARARSAHAGQVVFERDGMEIPL